MAAELAKRVTISDVARRIATSQRQLQRAFSEVGGASFRSYVTTLRMARAAHLLEATDLTVREIAARVGYREPSQFTKAFKRAYGATPSDFRQQKGGESSRS